MYYTWFWQPVYFQQFVLDGLRGNYYVNIENYFHMILVVIYVTLNVKPLKKCMYFWVPSIDCPRWTPVYINYMANRFVSVVWKRIIDIMIPVKIINYSSLLSLDRDALLVYFSSLHPRFVSLFQLSLLSDFKAYILALWVYFSRLSCLFFKPTSSLC